MQTQHFATKRFHKPTEFLQLPTLCKVRYDQNDDRFEETPFRLSRLGHERCETSVSDTYYEHHFLPKVFAQSADIKDDRNEAQFSQLFQNIDDGIVDSPSPSVNDDDEYYILNYSDYDMINSANKKLRFKTSSNNKDGNGYLHTTDSSWIGSRRESGYATLDRHTDSTFGAVSSVSRPLPSDWSLLGASRAGYRSVNSKYYSDLEDDAVSGSLRWLDEMRRWVNTEPNTSFMSFVGAANMTEKLLSSYDWEVPDRSKSMTDKELCDRFLHHFHLGHLKPEKPPPVKRVRRKIPTFTTKSKPLPRGNLWKAPPPPKFPKKSPQKVHFTIDKPAISSPTSPRIVKQDSVDAGPVEPVTAVESYRDEVEEVPPCQESEDTFESEVVTSEHSIEDNQVQEQSTLSSPDLSIQLASSNSSTTKSRTPTIYKSPSEHSEPSIHSQPVVLSAETEVTEHEPQQSPDESQEPAEPPFIIPKPRVPDILDRFLEPEPVEEIKKDVVKPPEPKRIIVKKARHKQHPTSSKKMNVTFAATGPTIAERMAHQAAEIQKEEEAEALRLQKVIPELPSLPLVEPGSQLHPEEPPMDLPIRPRVPIELKGRRWGPKRKVRDLEAERERERLAELRKKKMEEMAERLRKYRVAEGQAGDGPRFEEYGWLAKFCILNRANVQLSRGTFEAVDIDNKGYLDSEELQIALKVVNSQLTTNEEMYLYRVLEICGYKLSNGADLKLFAVLSAISHKIAALDNWARTAINEINFQYLDMKLFMCKQLWESNADVEMKKMSIDSLIVELMAGGVSEKHVNEVKDRLGWMMHLELLDFLTYIPLFIMLHTSIIDHPLSTERNK